MSGQAYIDTVTDMLKRAYAEQRDVLDQFATLIADKVAAKNNIYLFGTGHGGIVAEEMFFRTGGLAVLNPIFHPGLLTNVVPITMVSGMERMDGVGTMILDGNRLEAGDLLVLHSVSGRNNAVIEMAIVARARGISVVGITSLAYSKQSVSRHKSGKRLFEVCDLVVDNMGRPGDAAVDVVGLPEAIGPTSTVVGCGLMHAVVIDAVEKMIARGLVPPVYMSANLDDGDAHNNKIFEEYREQIHYI